jgi:nicotinamidase-related amidase
MHKPAIHPDVMRRADERRGRLRIFDRLTPERTAHIVVDLQNGFMAPGLVAEIATAREIVPNDEHNATLSAMAHAFCDVIDTDTMVCMIEHVGAEAAMA